MANSRPAAVQCLDKARRRTRTPQRTLRKSPARLLHGTGRPSRRRRRQRPLRYRDVLGNRRIWCWGDEVCPTTNRSRRRLAPIRIVTCCFVRRPGKKLPVAEARTEVLQIRERSRIGKLARRAPVAASCLLEALILNGAGDNISRWPNRPPPRPNSPVRSGMRIDRQVMEKQASFFRKKDVHPRRGRHHLRSPRRQIHQATSSIRLTGVDNEDRFQIRRPQGRRSPLRPCGPSIPINW